MENNKETSLTIRLSAQIKEKLDEMLQNNGMKAGEYIRMLIELDYRANHK